MGVKESLYSHGAMAKSAPGTQTKNSSYRVCVQGDRLCTFEKCVNNISCIFYRCVHVYVAKVCICLTSVCMSLLMCQTLSCCYSVTQSCLTLCDTLDCSTPGFLSFTISLSSPKLMSIGSVTPSDYFLLCHPLLLPSVFPSIRVFTNESALCIRWPKYWRFSFSISPSNEYSGLVFFRIDWFDLLAVQGTFKSLLQHHS